MIIVIITLILIIVMIVLTNSSKYSNHSNHSDDSDANQVRAPASWSGARAGARAGARNSDLFFVFSIINTNFLLVVNKQHIFVPNQVNVINIGYIFVLGYSSC